MTQDEIIEMATKVYGENEWHESALFHLEAFAKLVAEKAAEREREECARVCESGADAMHPTVEGHVMKNFGKSTHLAQAIRARGEA